MGEGGREAYRDGRRREGGGQQIVWKSRVPIKEVGPRHGSSIHFRGLI